MPDTAVEHGLVAAWLAARSISRNLPAPVPDHGGLRVETGSAAESRRYVFVAPTPGLAELGRSVADPLTLLKLCGNAGAMRQSLPARWSVEDTGFFMACDGSMPFQPVPPGYRLALSRNDVVIRAVIEAEDGAHAASGYAVEHGRVFAFDRIVTEPEHRRRGLGAALMTALAGARVDPASRFVLVATPAGRTLYESLGWRILSPYSTARLLAPLSNRPAQSFSS